MSGSPGSGSPASGSPGLPAAAGPAATPRDGRVDDALAGLLLTSAWVALALASRQWLAMSAPLAGLLVFPAVRGRVHLRPGPIGWGLLALPFALMIRFREVSGVAATPFNDSFHLGLFGVCAGVVALYGPPARARLPWVVLLTGLALASAGGGLPGYVSDAQDWTEGSPLGALTPRPWALYAGCSAVYALGALALLRRALRLAAGPASAAPLAALAGCVALAAALTAAGSHQLEANYDAINAAFLRLARGTRLVSAGGFSDRADLGSVVGVQQQDGGGAIALRAFADGAPGYLRGRVFTTYRGAGWDAVRREARMVEAEHGRVVLPGRPTPPLGVEARLQVHPTSTYALHFFLPLQAAAVGTASERVRAYRGGILHTADRPTSRGYDVFRDPTPVDDAAHDPANLALPDDPVLLAALDRLLAQLGLRPGVSVPEAVGALARYFQDTYRYSFGITFRGDVDPLVEFLQEKRHGHCELFASSGVLLLRRLGLPARYVTGFVCAERNPLVDSLWLARDRHAHAWVEVLDPGRGWQLAELTPAGGLPSTAPASGGEALLDGLAGAWAWLAGLFRDGLAGLPLAILRLLAAAGGWVIAAWWRMALLALLLAGYALRRLARIRRARAAARPPRRALSPELAAERDRYLALERRLARAGLGRVRSETLLEYAARLAAEEALPAAVDRAEALELLRGFALRRYACSPAGPPRRARGGPGPAETPAAQFDLGR